VGAARARCGDLARMRGLAVSPDGTSWHLMTLRDRTKFSE
jgi:hypothetical protein